MKYTIFIVLLAFSVQACDSSRPDNYNTVESPNINLEQSGPRFQIYSVPNSLITILSDEKVGKTFILEKDSDGYFGWRPIRQFEYSYHDLTDQTKTSTNTATGTDTGSGTDTE